MIVVYFLDLKTFKLISYQNNFLLFCFRFLYLLPEEIETFATVHKHTPLKKQVK